MSRFLCEEMNRLDPYTPGEQPRDKRYIKLNTNESPFPPSPKVLEAVNDGAVLDLRLYSDPTCQALAEAAALHFGLRPNQILAGNGSDENLTFAFRAFCGEGRGMAFADITYGFYRVWAKLWNIPTRVVPLREDFTLCVDDYLTCKETIVIANPNAPTGMAVPASDIRRLLEADPDRVVIVDEAYVDFGGESCVPLLAYYDNLLVVQTMSKSRSLAGARLGFCLGSTALIDDLNRIKYSFNPYNVNRLTLLAGQAALKDTAYFKRCTETIRENRSWTAKGLKALDFTVLPSVSNFLFAKTERRGGEALYLALKEKGILVRWFNADRIREYVRITIGTRKEMAALLSALREILEV